MIAPIRGLKPTAKFIPSLRDEENATFVQRWVMTSKSSAYLPALALCCLQGDSHQVSRTLSDGFLFRTPTLQESCLRRRQRHQRCPFAVLPLFWQRSLTEFVVARSAPAPRRCLSVFRLQPQPFSRPLLRRELSLAARLLHSALFAPHLFADLHAGFQH